MAVRFVFLIFICLSIALTNTQDLLSPCPRLFIYEPERSAKDKWYGIVTLLSEEPLANIMLRLTFDNPALQFGNWFGQVRTDNKISYLVENRNYTLDANFPYPLRFFVKYDTSKPVPQLTGIQLNGKTICPDEVGTTVTPFLNTKPQTTAPSIESTSLPPALVLECGQPDVTKPIPLILDEANSTDGEWPWHIALYEKLAWSIRYRCGGSLISDRLIVTTAHCVADLYTGDTRGPSKFIVYLGSASANIEELGPGSQIVRLSRIRIHPKYSRENYHNDIAILKTERAVNLTSYVKPVCLWEGDNNITAVVGQLGTVVSWGIYRNDNSIYYNLKMKQIKILIVDPLDCIYSNPEFFAKYTSVNSFCAGLRIGSSTCIGDSGSGLVLSQKDANNKITWYLRGLVSVRDKERREYICDPTDYTVFTDVAKHIPWIKKTLDSI